MFISKNYNIRIDSCSCCRFCTNYHIRPYIPLLIKIVVSKLFYIHKISNDSYKMILDGQSLFLKHLALVYTWSNNAKGSNVSEIREYPNNCKSPNRKILIYRGNNHSEDPETQPWFLLKSMLEDHRNYIRWQDFRMYPVINGLHSNFR